jgi:transposase
MDWGSLGDSGHAGTEARDRSPRCATAAEAPAGRPLSPNLGGELGKSRFATTSVASASFGADAHPDHESVASRSPERGVRRKKRLWGQAGRVQLESFVLAPWARRRRQELLELLDRLNPSIRELNAAVEQEAARLPEMRRFMTHLGVGSLAALAFVLIVGTLHRFACGKQIASYVGLVPSEESSGSRRRLGHISKQGNSLLRFLLVEAAQATVHSDPDWRRKFLHLAMRRERGIAKVAMARKLAVRLYWMWRKEWDYEQVKRFGSHARQPENPLGVQ